MIIYLHPGRHAFTALAVLLMLPNGRTCLAPERQVVDAPADHATYWPRGRMDERQDRTLSRKAARCNERPISLNITTFLSKFLLAHAAKAADDVLFCKNLNIYNIFVVIRLIFARFYNVELPPHFKTYRSPQKCCRFSLFPRKKTTFAIKWKGKRRRLMSRPRAMILTAAVSTAI